MKRHLQSAAVAVMATASYAFCHYKDPWQDIVGNSLGVLLVVFLVFRFLFGLWDFGPYVESD